MALNSGSDEQPSSKAVKRAALAPPLIATVWRGKREVCLHGHLDLNGNIHTSSPATVDSWEKNKTRPCHEENEATPEDSELKSEPSQQSVSEGRRLLFTFHHHPC